MTSKSKTLKTKVTPAAKKPAAKVPAKVVKAVAAKKVTAPTVTEPKTEIKKSVEILKDAPKAVAVVKKAAVKVVAKTAAKPVTKPVVKAAAKKVVAKPVVTKKIITKPVPKVSNITARSKLVMATAAPKTTVQSPARLLSMKALSAAIDSNSATTVAKPAPLTAATYPKVSVDVNNRVAPGERIIGKTMSVQDLFKQIGR